MDRSDRFDGVYLFRALVGPVALHPREAQRDTAGIAAARLHAVERDLDDQLWTDVHDVPVGALLKREQPFRLPGESLVS